MKDPLSLAAAAAVLSLAAWAFWHYVGADALFTLVTVMLVVVAADNARLRRRLRNHPLG